MVSSFFILGVAYVGRGPFRCSSELAVSFIQGHVKRIRLTTISHKLHDDMSKSVAIR